MSVGTSPSVWEVHGHCMMGDVLAVVVLQSARRGTQSVKDAVADALDHLLQLLPHKSKEDGAAVDWKFLGVAAGCVATTAVAVFAVYR